MSATRTADNILRFPGEAPLQAPLKEWLDDLEDVLGDDYGAAFSGTDPMLVLEYALFPMDTIPALTADAANDITPSMVMRREETRATKEFINAQSLLKRAGAKQVHLVVRHKALQQKEARAMYSKLGFKPTKTRITIENTNIMCKPSEVYLQV